jgi:hypothetical protein
MAAVLPSRFSLASLSLAALALTPMALLAQARTSAPPVEVRVIVVQPAITVVTQAPVTVQRPERDPAAVRVRWGGSWYPATRLRAVWGPYALYRFDGYGAEWDSVMHERDVRSAYDEQPLPAWQAETPGLALPDSHVIRRGEALMGEWHGGWFAIRVLRVRGETARIRYDGYGAEWDEDMPRSRIRLRDPETTGPVPALPPEARWSAVDPQSPPQVGQHVAVRQGGATKYATVQRTDGPLFWVHYRGMSRAFDEPVTLDRIAGIPR